MSTENIRYLIYAVDKGILDNTELVSSHSVVKKPDMI